MATTPQTSDYILFMQWLQEKHPDLYMCCWDSVTASDNGLFINEKGLALEHYKGLLLALEEYYGIEK